MAEPFAYIAHKNGKFGGVCSTLAGKRSVREFVDEFLADGFTVEPVSDREHYLAMLDKLEPWHGSIATTSHQRQDAE